MAFLTIGQAVNFTGKSKTTIHKLTKNGKLSVAKKNSKGHNLYDTSELARVFGEPLTKPKKEPRLTQEKASSEPVVNRVVELLEQQNKELKEQLDKLEQKNQDLETKNDKLTDELLNINRRLLEPPKRKKLFGFFR